MCCWICARGKVELWFNQAYTIGYTVSVELEKIPLFMYNKSWLLIIVFFWSIKLMMTENSVWPSIHVDFIPKNTIRQPCFLLSRFHQKGITAWGYGTPERASSVDLPTVMLHNKGYMYALFENYVRITLNGPTWRLILKAQRRSWGRKYNV